MLKSAIATRVSMRMIRRTDMEYLFGKVVIFTKAIMLMMKGMAMEKCNGQMALVIWESGERVYSMVEAK